MTSTATETVSRQANPQVRGGVAPYLMVDGAARAAEFYVRAFGAEEVARHPVDETGRTMHVHLYLNGGSLMLSDAYPEQGHPLQAPAAFSLLVHVDDVERWWRRALAAGCEVVMPLEDMFWGDRYGQLRDPFGVIWALAAPTAGPAEEAHDERFDLVLTRRVDAPRARIWEALTRPELVERWFAPAPWTTVECEIELRPGGVFRTVMRSPEGEDFPNAGCFLEVVEHERLVWTDALAPGYRPAANPFFTAVITLEDEGGGTRYTARALHRSEADRKTHEEMGFLDGWGLCLEQLVAVANGVRD